MAGLFIKELKLREAIDRILILCPVPLTIQWQEELLRWFNERERTSTEAGAAEAALLRLYAEVWLPKSEEGGLTVEKIAAGGRPLQVTLNKKKQAAIHERVEELITSVQPCVFASLHPNKIVELFALGTASGQTPGRSVPKIVEGFFSFPISRDWRPQPSCAGRWRAESKRSSLAISPALRQHLGPTANIRWLQRTYDSAPTSQRTKSTSMVVL
jgi:hypothetical protein